MKILLKIKYICLGLEHMNETSTKINLYKSKLAMVSAYQNFHIILHIDFNVSQEQVILMTLIFLSIICTKRGK